MQAEIVAVGSELLSPYKLETNSLFLAGELNRLGVEVVGKRVVGDSRPRLIDAARDAMAEADIVIFIGGLGPTEDDLTREAVAAALDISLHRQAELVASLRARFAEHKLRMAPNNERQADVLTGAEVLPNARGSAPGQWLQTTWNGNDRFVVLLPGPPHELEAMFRAQCLERLRAVLPPAFIAKKVLKTAMIGESDCDARIAPIYSREAYVQTTLLAGAGEVQIHLQASATSMEKAQAMVDDLAGKIEEELEERIFSTGGESLEQVVGYYLQMRGSTLAVAESCTGGLLSQRITSVPGSSRYFLGGAVVYDNRLKEAFTGVSAELLTTHGAVSRQVAAGLAEGIRDRCGSSLGAAATGIAGPGGGSAEKPVGLVYLALADGRRTEVVERRFPGDRERIRWYATQQLLDMIRRRLMEA